MKTRTETVVDVGDWDKLVNETYGRPYSFQQQDGSRERGTFKFTVPYEALNEPEMNDSIPEIVNHDEMGVKFSSWLSRDPKQTLVDTKESSSDKWSIELWWHRNFYPDIQTVANDLHQNGLLEAGDYTIDINW